MPSTVIAVAVAYGLMGTSAMAQTASTVQMPPEIGAAYGRLGKAITTHDPEGGKSVRAEDSIVNAPSNTVLHRDEVIAAMAEDLLDYRDLRKTITLMDQKPGAVVVMGYDTMVPLKGPAAGR